jgi:hypothetical protein
MHACAIELEKDVTVVHERCLLRSPFSPCRKFLKHFLRCAPGADSFSPLSLDAASLNSHSKPPVPQGRNNKPHHDGYAQGCYEGQEGRQEGHEEGHEGHAQEEVSPHFQ